MASTQMPFCRWKFCITLAVVAAALAVNFLFHLTFGTKLLFFLFLVAVSVAAHFEGLGAGLLATALTSLAVLFFFVEPIFSFAVSEPYDWVRLVVFAFCGIIAITSELLADRTRKRTVETWLKRARGKVDEKDR